MRVAMIMTFLGPMVAMGCGGAKPAETALPSSGAGALASAPSASVVAVAAPSPGAESEDEEISPASKAAAAAATPAPLPNGAPIPFENLLGMPAPTDFPAKQASDATCFTTVPLTGQNDKDYAALTDKCGAGTGMKPFIKAVKGKLGDKHLRDVYDFKMLGGYCYRFFAVADESISNVDIRVQKPSGAIVSVDSTKGPIAILDPDRPWCKKHDREFSIVVETAGGSGNYTFGIWARPK
jgi:hypothetical protein